MGQHLNSDLAQGAFRNAGGLRIDIACRHWKTRLSCLQSQGLICLWPPGLVNLAAFGAPGDSLVCRCQKGKRPRNLGKRKLELPVLVRRFANHIYIYI